MGVSGLSASPHCIPAARIAFATARGLSVASMWNVIWDAPASAISFTHLIGYEIMQWTSRKTSGKYRRNEAITHGPTVRLGTKWPSITSTWIHSAEPFLVDRTSLHSSANIPKSAASMDGLIIGYGFAMKRAGALIHIVRSWCRVGVRNAILACFLVFVSVTYLINKIYRLMMWRERS